MLLAFLTLSIAIVLSSVAALYSVVGLVAIFSGSPIAIAIMGGVLEMAKLVVATYLYRMWDVTPKLLKAYFILALLVLMFITSLGIFGYLSQAHIESSSSSFIIQTEINNLKSQIQFKELEKKQYESSLENLDKGIKEYYTRGRVTLGLKELKEQEEIRKQINDKIAAINSDILSLTLEQNKLLEKEKTESLKVGPLRYVAELVFGESKDQFLEKSVRYLIIIIMFVFDPLAVLLVIAANICFEQRKKPVTSNTFSEPKKKKKQKETASLADYISVPIAATEDGVKWSTKQMNVKGE